MTEARAQGRSSATCLERHATALGQIACELASQIPAAPGVIEVTADVTTSVPASSSLHPERLEALARELSALVAGELGTPARAVETRKRPLSAAPQAGERRLVIRGLLVPERFTATADLILAPQHFWDRFRSSPPSVVAHAFAVRALDAELRAHLPPIPLVLSRVDKAAGPDESSVALACGDLDSDGSLEIISVGRRRIQVGRIAQGRFVPARAVAWSDLSEVAPVPLREPLGFAWLRGPGALEVASSDRADGVRLDGSLSVVTRFAGKLPLPGGECARVLPTGVASERVPCAAPAKARTTGPTPPAGDTMDAFSSARLIEPSGASVIASATRSSDGTLAVRLGERTLPLEGAVGAALALGDLNGDGQLDLLTTENTFDASTDALTVRTFEPGGPREAFRVAVPTGVRALTICPSEGEGLAPIVLATGDSLWVLR